MGFADVRARVDGRSRMEETTIRSVLKRRGPSDFSGLMAPGPSASMFGESYQRQQSTREAYGLVRNWVWSCVHAVAKRCAGQPWMAGHFERPQGRRTAGPLTAKGYNRQLIPKIRKAAYSADDIEQDPEHPVLWLLDKPNSVQGKAEFVQMLVMNILATGEWYWIGGVTGSGDKQKAELWAVPSAWIQPDHRKGVFKGFILQTGMGSGIPLAPENVARGYFPNPADPKACLAPLAATAQSARIDEYILNSQEASFERGINPNLIVTIGKHIGPDGKPQASPPRLTGAQRRQIIRAVRHIWSQTVAQGDPAILDGLIDDVKKLQMTPQEMDWQNSGNTVKARIMQAFGVNPIILGEVTPANKAQAVVAEHNFLRNVVNPILEGISKAASEFFTPFYDDGETLAVWLEQAEARDEEMEFRRWSEARKNGDVTQDQYLGYMGLPPVDPKDREPKRSPLFNNPQTLAQVAALAAQVSAGAMSHDNAVQTLVVMLQISKADAEKMIPDDPPEPPPMPSVPPGSPPGSQGGPPAPGKPESEPKPPADPEAEDADAKGSTRLKYSPDQPRDEQGRWGSGGGGGVTSIEGMTFTASRYDPNNPDHVMGEQVRQKIASYGGKVKTEEQAREVGKLVQDRMRDKLTDKITDYQQASSEYHAARKKLEGATDDAAKAAATQEVRDRAAGVATAKKAYDDAVPAAYKEAMSGVRDMGVPAGVEQQWRSGIGVKQAMKDEVNRGFDLYPSDWVEKSAGSPMAAFRASVKEGGSYEKRGGVLKVTKDAPNEVVHELGHRFQDMRPGIRTVEREFYERRTAGQSAAQMKGYPPSEKAKGDQFASEYVGRVYAKQAPGQEIFSTGIEGTIYNSYNMRFKDPEHVALTLGILAGM